MRLALAFLLIATPAIGGGIPDWCLEEIEKGNQDKVRRFAESLLSRPFPYNEEEARNGVECLLHHTGLEYQYSTTAKEFVLPEERAAREAAAEARAAEKARAAEAEKQAERDRIEAGKREEDEEDQRIEDMLRRAAENQARREAAVAQRLGEACERLYKRAPDETIANKLCFDYFLTTGLPD